LGTSPTFVICNYSTCLREMAKTVYAGAYAPAYTVFALPFA
jgi:hypothetical protein